MNIRPMTPMDVSAVYALGSGQKEFSTETAKFWSEDQLRRWCQNSNDVTLVAEEDGRVVGFSLYAVHIPTGKVTWENVYVDPSVRKKGIGSALIEEGLRCVKEKGYPHIVLQDNNADQKAFAEYLKQFGFVSGHTVLWIDQLLS